MLASMDSSHANRHACGAKSYTIILSDSGITPSSPGGSLPAMLHAGHTKNRVSSASRLPKQTSSCPQPPHSPLTRCISGIVRITSLAISGGPRSGASAASA